MDYKKLERKIEKLKEGDLEAFDYIYDWTTKEEIKARKELTLKTDVESLYLKKSPSRRTRKNSSYKEEDNEEYSSNDNKELMQQSNKEIIYKTTQTENNVTTAAVNETKREKDKDDTKCCVIF